MVYDIYEGQSKFGKGLFANRDFKKDDHIFTFKGDIITFRDTLEMGADECYPVQIDKTLYLNPASPYKFINHSCDPNGGIINQFEVIALKDIKKGDEIFFDYSTSMLEKSWSMNCLCESENCRTKIVDFDQIPIKIQHHYLKLGIVQPFILKELQKQTLSDCI